MLKKILGLFLLALLFTSTTVERASAETDASNRGTLIIFKGRISYNDGTGMICESDSELNLGVLSELAKDPSKPGGENNPLYLTLGWRQVHKYPNGNIRIYENHTSDGLFVLLLKRLPDRTFATIIGLQLNDGRVLFDGVPITREE